MLSENFIYIITLIILGNIIGWPLIFSIIKQPNTLKQKLANWYIIFLVGFLNHGRASTRFIAFIASLGLFLTHKIILFLSTPFPKSIFIGFFFPFLFFYLSLIFLIGYFILCLYYPKIFGKFLINFFEQNANKEILRLILPRKKKLTFLKKKYSTISIVTTPTYYEFYISIRTSDWDKNAFMDKFNVIQVGKALDDTVGISHSEGFDILNKCLADPKMCHFYIRELAKSPGIRDLSREIFPKIKQSYRPKSRSVKKRL
jgi:hypothetical protein